jgi:putative Mg2+ transporter-C (MgtC) family protein
MGLTTFPLDVLIAVVLGAAIGIERQFGAHPAGVRTNTLVCVGAAFFVGLSRLLQVRDGGAMVPIAAQVVSGVGFLGGGVILREGVTIRGINTAATLWCSAAVGSLTGAGFLVEATIAAAVILTSNLALRPLVEFINGMTRAMVFIDTTYEVRVVCQHDHEAALRQILLRHVASVPSMQLQGLSVLEDQGPERANVVAEVLSSRRDDRKVNDLVSRLSIEPTVRSVSWQRRS